MLARDVLLERLREDLIGPVTCDERLPEPPSDRYLTGILFPRRCRVGAEEDERLGLGADDDDGAAEEQDAVQLSATVRPSTAGVSFHVAHAVGAGVRLHVRVCCGTYQAHHVVGEAGEPELARGPAPDDFFASVWVRTDHELEWTIGPLRAGLQAVPLPEHAPRGLQLHAQLLARGDGDALLTLALVNDNDAERGDDDEEEFEERSSHRRLVEEQTFFQASLEAWGVEGTRVEPHPSRTSRSDEDGEINALIYRDVRQYAVGHTCSADWEVIDGVLRVRTDWIPSTIVPAVSARGGKAFGPLLEGGHLRPLSARWLSTAAAGELVAGLEMLPACYAAWLDEQEARVASLDASLQDIARTQLERCRQVAARMRGSIQQIGSDEQIRRAFQLANEAIATTVCWKEKRSHADLTWRPFQLGFQLLALSSLADRRHPDREVMDLLWFPTGGGKTEAYLGLAAFLLFHRRIRQDGDPDAGAGTAMIMRYTLRALTIQQFQRAAALVLACECLRRRKTADYGEQPFSIGLWVGGGATPNTVKEAAEIKEGSDCDHRQLRSCPCCHRELSWDPDVSRKKTFVRCGTKGCELGANGFELPIWTVDEDIYREVPTLLVATVDKFAQITRREEVSAFFGACGAFDPPDLILQDELHLISGPLGTIAGLYEIAIDHLCTRDGVRPKIIGSTATIRRAGDQIRNLFDRDTCQFPPPALDQGDSCFAVIDPDPALGRRYTAVTTAGRSPKFTLQAVSASLAQSAMDSRIPEEKRAGYSTLLVYFNSLRELGGALVLMQDDVRASLQAYALRRPGEAQRNLEVPEELTSRRSAAEIRDLLELLEKVETSPEILLASNMISVGVDIPRLGLMVVNGQPKTIAEYIQATSRVGRGDAPGLILGIYNANRVRDRSHYESFRSWHEGIYRQVEATSVTPFASRAIDKALHAVLVALARHTVRALEETPTLTETSATELRELRRVILARVQGIDPGEREGVEALLEARIQQWVSRGSMKKYWDDQGRSALMMSAEQYAAILASGAEAGDPWPTPNSMRDVEPGTMFRLGFRPRTEAPGN
ncbi:MAG: DNA/RNA helicase [Planctomycetes bacterium]|nr:DNA/RNA helicase [Planctomycetota bacterium]